MYGVRSTDTLTSITPCSRTEQSQDEEIRGLTAAGERRRRKGRSGVKLCCLSGSSWAAGAARNRRRMGTHGKWACRRGAIRPDFLEWSVGVGRDRVRDPDSGAVRMEVANGKREKPKTGFDQKSEQAREKERRLFRFKMSGV